MDTGNDMAVAEATAGGGPDMGSGDEWSPDEDLGTETFRQGDVAEDEGERLNPLFLEELEQDPSLDPALLADELELRELGAQLDDPELLVTLEGGMDDPDGIGGAAPPRPREGQEGWDLGAPLVGGPDGAYDEGEPEEG
jgi:hypothetical protein